jgi:tetratricopeptide (TPR) repeat protein
LYNESGAAERIALHRRIGEALEEIYASDVSPHLAELAHHYQQSRDTDKAIEYSIRAGEAMKKSFAFEEAIEQWQTALELMERQAVSPERRARHLYALGKLCRYASVERAVAYTEQAIALFSKGEEAEQAAKAHILAGQLFSGTNFGKRGDANTMNVGRFSTIGLPRGSSLMLAERRSRWFGCMRASPRPVGSG